MKDHLSLKWGTWKSYELHSEMALKAMEKFLKLGTYNVSAMMDRNNMEERLALCEVCDAVKASGGQIYLEWDGKYVSAEEAKKYIMEY